MPRFSDEIPFRTVGLDLGDLRSAYCRLDEGGHEIGLSVAQRMTARSRISDCVPNEE
jgi:hypothetical protein